MRETTKESSVTLIGAERIGSCVNRAPVARGPFSPPGSAHGVGRVKGPSFVFHAVKGGGWV